VPINEKMHWYLAIITNPFYSIREEEKKRGLYESSGEEEDEEMVDEELDNGGHVDDSKEEAKESAEVASALQSEESKAEQVETMGDTVMEEEKGPKVEVVIPTPSAKAPDEPTKVITSEQMDVDGNDSDDQGRAPFEVKSDADLMHGYEAGRRNLRTTKVIDNRSTPRTSINVSDSDSDDPVLVQSTSARKNKSSQYGRPGLSDGIRNKGNGKSVGGGGGTSFEPGQISDFLKEEEEMAAAKKRKAEEIEEHDVRMGSPLRSRSGTVYNSKTAVQPEKRQEVQERYREWLKKKSVVCVFDSLASTHKAVKTALKEYLCLEYNDKRRDKSMEEIMLDDIELEHIDVASPTQGNFCDCGLYLLHAFERFFSDPKKVMSKLIVFKNRDDPYWQSENAAKKRQWWRSCIKELIEEYQAEQAQIKADKEARLALKSSAAKVESEAKSKTASPSEGSRGTSQTSETTPLEVPSAAESSMEEPKVVRAT
jgi:Ulp1 family protease